MIDKQSYGVTSDGQAVDQYTLTNARGMVARIINFGATITELRAPDRGGRLADVVLGFDELKCYEGHKSHIGCVVGRVAGRIAEARFTLDGREHQLAANNGRHHLHGGVRGFGKRVWRAAPWRSDAGPAVKLDYRSPDGEENYPGNLEATTIYTLTDDNALRIDYTAVTDAPTLVNLTNHSYFNLAGPATDTILDHVVRIHASRYTPMDAMLIPTGELAPVADTPLDFTQPTTVGARIDRIPNPPGGYDLNYMLDDWDGSLRPAAWVHDPTSGRVMHVQTTSPGVVFYSGNFLNGSLVDKHSRPLNKRAGLCLETQHFPDAIHHDRFPSIVLRPGQPYRQTCIYRFSLMD